MRIVLSGADLTLEQVGAVARPGAMDDKLFKVPFDAVVQGDDRVDHGVNVLAWIKWTDAQPRTPVRDR